MSGDKTSAISIFSRSRVAGAVKISPSIENLDPWHGQSHDFSVAFHVRLHFICVRLNSLHATDFVRPYTKPSYYLHAVRF